MSSSNGYKKTNFRICVVDPEEQNVYLCRHLADEGNEVLLMSACLDGTNLYDKAHSPDELMEWNPDFCLFTRAGLGPMAYQLYSQGIKTVAGGLIQDQFMKTSYVLNLAHRMQVDISPDPYAKNTVQVAALFSKVGFCGPALRYEQGELIKGSPCLVLCQEPLDSPVTHALYKLQKVTSAVDFCGWLMVTYDLDRNKITFVDHITPPGFWAAFIAGLEQPLGWLLSSLAVLEKKKRFRYKFTEAVCGTVKVSIPPPVYHVMKETGNLPALSQAGANTSHLLQVSAVEGHWSSTGPEIAWVADRHFHRETLLQSLLVKSRNLLESDQPNLTLGQSLELEVTEEVPVHVS